MKNYVTRNQSINLATFDRRILKLTEKILEYENLSQALIASSSLVVGGFQDFSKFATRGVIKFCEVLGGLSH